MRLSLEPACRLAIALGLAAGFETPAAAAAQSTQPPQCALVTVASLPMQTEPDGTVSIPASINGKPVQFLVDTGGWVSVLSIFFAEASGLQIKAAATPAIFMNNVVMSTYAQAKDFNLGAVHGVDLYFYLANADQMHRDDDGMLAPDIMRHFDMDFDFAGGKLNAFSPNSCPAAPVYWTHQNFAQLPLVFDQDFHITADGLLDGQKVLVTIDTGASRSTMNYEAAQALFGWAEQDPRVKRLPSQRINNGDPVPIYRYPFGTLALDGVQVLHPDIDMIPQENYDKEGPKSAQITLGMSVLRQLHLYIGYEAKTLYIS